MRPNRTFTQKGPKAPLKPSPHRHTTCPLEYSLKNAVSIREAWALSENSPRCEAKCISVVGKERRRAVLEGNTARRSDASHGRKTQASPARNFQTEPNPMPPPRSPILQKPSPHSDGALTVTPNSPGKTHPVSAPPSIPQTRA